METSQSREPWNKGKLIGQKPPLKLKDIWAIRIHLQLGKRIRQCLSALSGLHLQQSAPDNKKVSTK